MEQERIGTIRYFVMRKHLQNLIKVFHLRLNTRILSLLPPSHSSKEDKRVFNSYDSYCTVNCPFFPRNNGPAIVCGVQRHHIPQLWSLSVRYACPRARFTLIGRALSLSPDLSPSLSPDVWTDMLSYTASWAWAWPFGSKATAQRVSCPATGRRLVSKKTPPSLPYTFYPFTLDLILIPPHDALYTDSLSSVSPGHELHRRW